MRLSIVYEETISVDASQPPDKVKQLVLPIKEAVLAYQSQPLSKVKQLVLLHQVTALHHQSLIPSLTVCAISSQKKAASGLPMCVFCLGK